MIADVLPPVYSAAGLLAALFAFWTLWLRPHLESKHPVDGIPAPPNCHWFFGHLWLIRKQPLEQVMHNISCRFADSNGRTCMWQGPTMRAVILTKPKDARAVLMAEYLHHPVPLFKKHLVKFLGPQNIGLLNGRIWKHERSSILKSFSPEMLTISKGAMLQVANAMVSSLKQRLANQSSVTFDVERLMRMITLDVFGLTAFSHAFRSCETMELSAVAKAFDFLASDLFRRFNTGPLTLTNYFYSIPTKHNVRNNQERAVLRTFIAQAVQSRRQSGVAAVDGTCKSTSADLVTRLVAAHEMAKGTPVEDECTDQVLEDVILSLLFAGFDTTSVTLSYALFMISVNSKVRDACVEEIKTVGLNDPEKLVYVRAVIKEVLRLFPPGFMTTRFLQKPVRLEDGFVLSSGVNVIVPIWAIQRSKQNFEDPLAFLPERWVQPKAGGGWEEHGTSTHDVDAFLAFAAGARSCPGQKFAWQEAIIVLACLLKDLNFESLSGYRLEPERNGIVQHPKGGVPMKISLRAG